MEMQKEMLQRLPKKIDIGPIDMGERKERELVFDVDLDDYGVKYDDDDVWVNGNWLYMSSAMKVLDVMLREDFGYSKIFYVFSGRRGIHCWVCDEKARRLEDSERAAIVGYITSTLQDHPHMNRSLSIIGDRKYYPRLDVNVTTHKTHLLKSPFAIHPKTGKVCVPILDVGKCDQFDPSNIPSLISLTSLEGLDTFVREFKMKFLSLLKTKSTMDW